MKELERLKNKTSEDINVVSGKLLKNISTEIAHALSYIFNLSLETGVFPNCWKMSRTIPIHKKGKKECFHFSTIITFLKQINLFFFARTQCYASNY